MVALLFTRQGQRVLRLVARRPAVRLQLLLGLAQRSLHLCQLLQRLVPVLPHLVRSAICHCSASRFRPWLRGIISTGLHPVNQRGVTPRARMTCLPSCAVLQLRYSNPSSPSYTPHSPNARAAFWSRF